ncbi:MAG: 4-hydroxy-tetrahydrodipicolinate reductase [Saprospiraceae bacterium]|nr:4-hydroxy-tetrahydrodipicolinate reductase [Saprospiraceae bacterium]
MKIALIGYGKMGKTIEKVALGRGHEIVSIVASANADDILSIKNSGAEVAIEVTRPSSAAGNILSCISQGIPVICGTTAWHADEAFVFEQTRQKSGALVYASNFSVGVNLFFMLNEYLTELMKNQKEYTPSILEIHHTAKLDSPSGTAITLAQGIIAKRTDLSGWVNSLHNDPDVLAIISERKDPAPGTHVIQYESAIDTISIRHEAHNREGFATGAILAAEWIQGKKGVFGMKEVLSLKD